MRKDITPDERKELERLREREKHERERQKKKNAVFNAKYDRITITVPAGQKARIYSTAKKAGHETVNAYISALIFADISRREADGANTTKPD